MRDDQIVHIIDDDDAVRESLSFLLGASGFTTHTYESAEAFLAALPNVENGCVISDVRMPGLSGIQLLQHLNESTAALPVILVTGHGDIPLAVEAMKLGAVDFLEKPFDDERILAALNGACRRAREAGAAATERAEIETRLAALTNRERQVLDGLVAGHPNKTIAFDLGISARTVEVYRANLMTKMQANSLSDLVRMALITGVIEGGGPRT